jgi:hypothetical protein
MDKRPYVLRDSRHLPVSDIRLDETEHLFCSPCDLHKNTVVDLQQP